MRQVAEGSLRPAFRLGRSAGILATAMALTTCGDQPNVVPSGGERRKGAFPAIHADSILAWTSATRFVAGVVGHTHLELFELDRQLEVSNHGPLHHPYTDCDRPFPIAAATTDVNDDGRVDLLVMDPSCGNWIALQQSETTFDIHPWTKLLPETLALPYLEVLSQSDSWAASLSVLTFDSGQMVIDMNLGVRAPVSSLRLPQPRQWNNVTRLTFEIGSEDQRKVILQGGAGALYEIVQEASSVMLVPIESLNADTEYLEQFDGLDHLASSARCGGALGLGVFGPDAGSIPARLSFVARAEDRVAIRPIEVSGELDSMALLEVGTQSWVALLDRAGEVNRLRTARLSSDCASIVPGSQASQDFVIHRPKEIWLPEAADARDRFSGSVISGTTIDNQLVFVIYDGFALHVFGRRPQASTMHLRSHPIHDARTYDAF